MQKNEIDDCKDDDGNFDDNGDEDSQKTYNYVPRRCLCKGKYLKT